MRCKEEERKVDEEENRGYVRNGEGTRRILMGRDKGCRERKEREGRRWEGN